MSLVERDNELELLYHRLADCLAGASSVTLIGGALGLGKTALLQAVAERAAESPSTRVLTAYGNRGGQAESLDTLTQLFSGAGLAAEDQEELARLLAMGRTAALADKPCDGLVDQLPVGLLHQLAALLVRALQDRSVVILIDDTHLVDSASQQWLLHLARYLGELRAMIVLTNCEGPNPVSPLFHTELLRLPSYRRLTLKPISGTGAGRIVRMMTGEDDIELGAGFHAISGGNPLLLRALAQDRMAGGSAPGTLFRQAVFACLYRSQPHVRWTAEAVALLGDYANSALVGKLLDLGDEEVAANLDALQAMGLLVNLRFRHPDIRSAVLEACQERAQLHASAARLLYWDGLPVSVVAEHLFASGRAAEPWQVQVLESAADESADPEQAIAYLELAYQDSSDTGHRTRLALHLVQSAWRAQPASVVGGLTRLERLPQTECGTILAVAAHRFWSGNPRDAAGVLEEAISREAGRDNQIAVAAWAARMWLSTACPGLPVPPDLECADECELGVEQTRRAASVLHELLRGGCPATAAAQAEGLLRTVWLDDGMSAWAGAIAVTVLCYAERLDTAAAACDRLLEGSGRHRGREGFFAALRADIAVRQGNLPLAERYAQQAADQLPVAHWGLMAALLQGIKLVVAVGGGDLARAAVLADAPLPDALLDTRYGLRYLCRRGRYYLTAGQPNVALSDFLSAGRLVQRWGVDRPAMGEWRIGAAEAYLAIGMRAQARRLLDEQLALLGPEDHRVRGSTLRVLSALVPRHERIARLRQAADAAKTGGDRLELARVAAQLHDACRTAGQNELAKVAALQALKLADECRAVPLQRQFVAHRPADLAPSQTVEPDRLTASELRVASLAARGHTNRQIAGELHVTMSTVEQHLTKVYRKLNVRHRKELMSRMEQTV
ncbi:AAA family ATPase [Streptomyces tibetensis]|uniref:AAA family ATPase n=2 Tax=Bacteria TaxID=2 RepID=UPI0033C8C61C